jgi:subtilisin-like proprotein convertase family protein
VNLLAASLIAVAVTPTFTGEAHHDRQGGGQARHHARDVSAAGKHHRTSRTVTKTIASGGAIAIPAASASIEFGAANPYPATINVTGFKKGTITDVNLTLRGFGHTFTQDVDVLLVAPDGRNLVVMGDVGGIGTDIESVTDLTITFDDEADAPPPVGFDAGLTSGTFQPLDQFGLSDQDDPDLLDFPAPAPAPSGDRALSVFDGSNPNGEWQVYVLDDTDHDTGSLSEGVSLEITATVKSNAKQHKHKH